MVYLDGLSGLREQSRLHEVEEEKLVQKVMKWWSPAVER